LLIGKDKAMKISQGLTLLPNIGTETKQNINKTLKETTESFGDSLTQAIKDVNGLQQEAGNAVAKMVSGEAVDLHEVMIAAEKAKTSFDLLMEIRNKTIDAYRELMRMQV
jgi:flagellar hook-basal body complex protein FliE